MDNIERCLELWDSDGPTLAMKYYMQFFGFQPLQGTNGWEGVRNIDEVIDQEKIDLEQNMGEMEEDEQMDNSPGRKSET